MRGATANSDKSASNIPAMMKTSASGATATPLADWLERNNRNKPQLQDSQVCAENSLAATPPASAGVGKCANSKGTTKKPIVLKLAHHSAATQTGSRDIRLYVADRHHFVVLDASRCLNFRRIAF